MKKFLFAFSFALIASLSAVSTARAAMVTISIPITVNGSIAVTASAGSDTSILQTDGGTSQNFGTSSSTAGPITSTTWSYVGCSPSCTKSGMVISGASGSSSSLQGTFVNMGGEAVGTHFTFKFTATDSAGNTGSDTKDVIIAATPYPDLTATYDSPTNGSPGTLTLSGTVTNIGSVATGSSFTSYFEVQGDPTLTWTSPGITLAASGSAGNSKVVSVTRAFNPASTTTYQIRLCADGANTVNEGSNEGNNCSSSWTALTVNVAPPVPSASINANPTSITSGGSSTITWNCGSSATSCSGTGFSTGGSNSGSVSVSPSSTTTYSVTASNSSGSNSSSATVTVTAPPPPPPPPGAACSDGIDNDVPADGKIDYSGGPNGEPRDPGCSSPTDNSETDPKPIFIEF